MKAIVCIRPGEFEIQEKDYPNLASGHSIVKIKQIGICGTDLNAFKGEQPYFSYPRVLGHELAAAYVEGDAAGFSKGDQLAIMPYKYCGDCFACKQGKTNCCSTLSVMGVHEDGGMCEFLSVPNHLLIQANGLSLDQIAMIEPLAIGAHAVRRAAIKKEDHVLVIGAGPIGIGLLHFLSAYQVKLILAETIPFRADYCRKNIPDIVCIDPSKENMVEVLMNCTNGNMPSVIFDATGNLSAINDSIHYLSHAGRYVLVGLQQGDIKINHPQFHKREATLMSSRNATKDDFMAVIDALRTGDVTVDEMITHRLKFENVHHDFSMLFNQKSNLIKAMITH